MSKSLAWVTPGTQYSSTVPLIKEEKITKHFLQLIVLFSVALPQSREWNRYAVQSLLTVGY